MWSVAKPSSSFVSLSLRATCMPIRSFNKLSADEYLTKIKTSRSPKEIVKHLTSEHRLPLLSLDHFRAGLYRLQLRNDYEKIEEVLKFMKQHSIEPDYRSYGYLFTSLHQKNKHEKLVDTYEPLSDSIKENDYNKAHYLNALAKLEQTDKVLEEFDTILKSGKPLNEYILNNVVEALMIAKRYDEAFDLLEEMEFKHKIRPTLHSYSIIIKWFSRRGDVKAVDRVLKKMHVQALPPNAITYATMIHGFASSGNVEEGFHRLQYAESHGIHLNIAPFMTLMKVLEQTKQFGYIIRLAKVIDTKKAGYGFKVPKRINHQIEALKAKADQALAE